MPLKVSACLLFVMLKGKSEPGFFLLCRSQDFVESCFWNIKEHPTLGRFYLILTWKSERLKQIIKLNNKTIAKNILYSVLDSFFGAKLNSCGNINIWQALKETNFSDSRSFNKPKEFWRYLSDFVNIKMWYFLTKK